MRLCHARQLSLGLVLLGVCAARQHASAATTRLALSSDQPSTGALADDPALRDFVTFDLLVTSDSDWTNSSLRFTLDAGSIYNASAGGSTPTRVLQWDAAGSRHLRFDTFVAGPPTLAAGSAMPFARHAADGPGPAVFSSGLLSVAWLDTASSYGPGAYTIARLTVSSDAIGSFSGWSFDSADAGVGQPFGGALNKQLRWDVNPASVDAQGGAGVWNSSEVRFWNGTTNVNWNNALRDVAIFGGPAGGAVTVGMVTASSLQFDAPGYVLSDGKITLSGSGRITANQPATIASDLAAAHVLTKDGSAALTLVGSLADLGGNLNVREGELLAGEVAGSGATRVAAGARLTANHLRVGELTLDAGATAVIRLNGGSAGVSRLNRLDIAGGPAPAAKLDLADNDLIVQGGDIAAVIALISSARNGGAGLWQGNGITTSAATPVSGLAAAENDRGDGTLLYSTFGGLPVDAGSVLIKFTYVGDADLTGGVDAADYFRIDRGRARRLTGWANGDFDYSGGPPGGDDYTLIDRSFLGSRAQPGALSAGVVAVPEPAWLTLFGAVVLAGSRRGKKAAGSAPRQDHSAIA